MAADILPSPADLIEALREPGESYEKLAARLPISLSTVSRWKKQPPRDWENIVVMLNAAGWLRVGGANPPAVPELSADPAFAEDMVELAQLLERVLQRVRVQRLRPPDVG